MKKKILFIPMFLLVMLSTTLLVGCESNATNSDSSLSEPSSTISEPISESDSDKVRPHTHSYSEWIENEAATLFKTGTSIRQCIRCDDVQTRPSYYLKEVNFTDKVYQYNGTERKLLISGLLPKDIHVEYENNTLTIVGNVVATANFIDKEGNTIESRQASLTIVPYKGLANLKIDTSQGKIIDSKETYTASLISVDNCSDQYIFNDISAGVRLRGNGTLEAAKKPYRIKFNQKQSMLGLNDNHQAKSWVLLAEYYDYSMMRNASAFYLGDSLLNNNGYYSSDFVHINLYINNVYNGVYLLAEQQQVNKGRVNISEPTAGYTGTDIGYLLELDHYSELEGEFFRVGDSSFTAYGGVLPTRSYAVKSDYYSTNQMMFISKYLNSVYKIFYSAVFKNEFYELDEFNNLVESELTSVYEVINKVINIDSLIKSYILEEVMKDIDVGFSSYYLFVDFAADAKFSKLTFGAPWDFDWSSGNVKGDIYYSTNNTYNNRFFDHMNPWLYILSQADFFKDVVKDYWNLLCESKTIENLITYMLDISKTYESEFNRNFQKWRVLGTSLHVYHSSEALTSTSHKIATEKFTNWLRNRKLYLDSQWL